MSEPLDPSLTELAHTGGGYLGGLAALVVVVQRVLGASGSEKVLRKLEQLDKKFDALDKKLAVRTEADRARDRRLEQLEESLAKALERLNELEVQMATRGGP